MIYIIDRKVRDDINERDIIYLIDRKVKNERNKKNERNRKQ